MANTPQSRQQAEQVMQRAMAEAARQAAAAQATGRAPGAPKDVGIKTGGQTVAEQQAAAEQARQAAMARPVIQPPPTATELAASKAAAEGARTGAMARPIPPPKIQTVTEFAQTQTMARPFNEKAWLESLPEELSQAYKEGGVRAYNNAVRQYNAVARREEAKFKAELRKKDSYLYNIYQEGGIEAYNEAVGKRERDITAITRRNYITLDDQRMKIKDWNQLDPRYQHIALNEGFDAMDRAIDADIAKYEVAEKVLEPYKTKEGDYDIVKYLEDHKGKEQVLLDAGFSKEAVKEASEYSKLGWHQKAWRGMTPWAEEKGETASAAAGAIMAAELIVPGVYLARHWSDLSVAEKAAYIAMDALIIFPFARAAGAGARVVGTAGKAARLAAATGAVGREALVQVKAPVNMIIHPVGAAKTTIREVRNLAETIAHPRKIPEAVITTSDGLVMLKVDKNMTPAQAMAAQEMLMQKASEGQRLFVTIGNQTVELTTSPLMREARKSGGALAHVTPDIRDLETATKVKAKPGQPLSEQGWFLSHEPPTQFTASSASGVESVPVPKGASEKVFNISKYKAGDIVRLDKQPVRELNFANAKNIPDDLAQSIQRYAEKNNARLYGSFNEHLKVKGAGRPNDFDLAFRNQSKAINDIMAIARKQGYEVKRVSHGIAIKYKGEWVKLGDIDSIANHGTILPTGLSRKGRSFNGIEVENLGEQYLRQSYGSIAKDVKAPIRAKKLNKAASDVKRMLQKAGVGEKKPGIFIIGEETAEKTVGTKKLWKAKDIGWTAEMERKLGVGGDFPKAKQRLFTRIGPTSQRVEIFLEKPLSARQIARLKAEGLIEWAKAPFKEPIKVRGKGVVKGGAEAEKGVIKTIKKVKIVNGKKTIVTEKWIETGKKAKPIIGIDTKQTQKLSKILKKSGNIDQADNLLRVERIAASTRRVAPALSRVIGRVRQSAINEARERMRLESTVRAKPERAAIGRAADRIPARERLNIRARAEKAKAIRAKATAGGGRGRLERERVEREAPEHAERAERGERVETPSRTPRVPKIPRTPRTPRVPRIPRTPRTPGVPRIPRIPRVPRIPRTPRKPGVPKIPRKPGTIKLSDENNRGLIAKSGGAIAWRMGQLHGKPRWDVIVNPYKSNEHYMMVFGKPPKGAAIAVGGPRSAYRTAQMLYGKPPSKAVHVDSGFQDIITTASGRKIQLHFKPDPKLETKGDISIGGRGNRISNPSPRISNRMGGISGRRGIRISPRLRKLR